MQEQNSSKLCSKSLLKRGCKQSSVNTRQHLSFPSGSSTQWRDNETREDFSWLSSSCVDAPDFLKFISSSGTATETTGIWERDSRRCLQWHTKSLASGPSFLIQPKLAAVRTHCQLTALWWPTRSDLASSCYRTDVRSVESVSIAGMCFIFRGWEIWE